MNLLIDPDSLAENSPAPGGSAGSGTSAPAADAKRTAIDENTQEQIRSALETELIDSAAPAPRRPVSAPEAEPAKTPVQEPATAPEPVIEPEPVIRPEPVIPPEPVILPEVQETVPRSEEVAPSAPEETAEADDKANDNDDDYICFNVTQALVEDKTEKYMQMFGMCTCSRCRIDVIALALSNLPAKYVVARPKDMIPRLSMYESKYSAAVITQVMKACKKVIDLPHHKR